MRTNRRNFFKKMSIATVGLTTGLHSDLLGMSLVPPQEKKNTRSPIPQKTNFDPSLIQCASPADHGEALINPGMGWVTYFYSNLFQNYGSKLAPSDAVRYFPGMNTVFLRIPWAFIEPEENNFVWEILDTPTQRWVDHGGPLHHRD